MAAEAAGARARPSVDARIAEVEARLACAGDPPEASEAQVHLAKARWAVAFARKLAASANATAARVIADEADGLITLAQRSRPPIGG